ncbi:MAG: PilW family protein [Rhodanobacter sp.]
MMLLSLNRRRSPSSQHGVTLIELLVAMVLGLLVAGGIITVFSSTSSSSKAQTQLARLQEEGRFAITRISGDLRMANGQYCNNSGGVASAGASGTLLDQLRAPRVYAANLIGPAGAISGALADVTTVWNAGTYPAAPTDAYAMPAFLFMRGYDCTLTACTPVDPHAAINSIPAMGAALGNRVKGSDVITVRYVNSGSGWAVYPTGTPGVSTLTVTTSGGVDTLTSVNLVQAAGEPPVSDFGGTDLAMLADCSSAQIFALSSVGGGVLTVAGTPDNLTATTPPVPTPQAAPKLFDVNRDFRTVTYYLKVVSVNNDGNAPFTGALIRRVNGSVGPGGSEDELVRGVERLDFRYGVEDSAGNTSFLTAAQVDSSTTNCPPSEPGALTPRTGCLWRAIKSIEVSVLMDGQVPLYTLSADNLKYAYSADLNPGLLAPGGHAYKPVDQGFPDQVLRREFTALVALRNFNP